MQVFEALAEQRIRDAQERGELDDLPGSGAPLELDDDALVPEELRVAYRLLKNAGHVPPEVTALRDLRELERALAQTDAKDDRSRLLSRISAVLLRSPFGGRRNDLRVTDAYYEKIAGKLTRTRRG